MAVAAIQTGVRPNPERRFYMAMVIAIIASVVLGFARSFFLRALFPGVHAPHETWFYIHGAIFTAWLVLLLVQASLVTAGNVALHQRLGLVSLALIPLMVVFGTIGALIAARRPGGFIDIPVPPLQFLVIPLTALLLFVGMTGTALLLRRSDPQSHKRLMLLATIAIAEAGVARWPFEPYISNGGVLALWTCCLFLIPLAAWDLYSRRRLHPATIAGAVLLLSMSPLRMWLMQTDGWMHFARWSTGLLG